MACRFTRSAPAILARRIGRRLTADWPNLVAATDRALPGFLTDKANWVPYAYGPVAIRSYGDVFDHGPHGLVGAINVMPTSFGA